MKSFLQLLSRVGMLNLMISLFMMPLYIPINSSNSKNKVQRKIPNVKRMRSYPAVLIGRIGVSTAFQNKGYDIGKQTINYIKRWFIHPDNKTGCRFVVVDAYNASKPLHFYEKNDFQYLYATEHEEKAAFNIPESEELHSRMMYFDLMQIQE